jgi:hypothetical protein
VFERRTRFDGNAAVLAETMSVQCADREVLNALMDGFGLNASAMRTTLSPIPGH